jgi:hypothetical protein
MTDGVTLNPGSGGAIIDTETNAGRSNAQMQRVKLVLGAVDTDGGDVGSTNPMPVSFAAFPGDISSLANSLASTLNAAYTITISNGAGVAAFAVSGLTASGATLTIECSDDSGTTWSSINGLLAATGALFQTLTTDQQFRVGAGGRTRIRLRVSVAGTGTITVSSNISVADSLVAISAPLPPGANTIGSINIGTAPVIAVTGTFFQTTQPISASALPLPSNASTSAGQVPPIAQGATITGATGAMVLGSVTTAAPAYTTGQISPPSLTTAGALRSDISSINGATLTASVAQLGVNVASLGNIIISTGLANGSLRASLGAMQTTAVSQIDQNAAAFAGSGSVLGTLVASTSGGGAAISSEINVSALALGTATTVFAILQESTGGTNFTDIWVSDPITTTGIVRMPAIPISGRRRWRFHSAGGTSTTVTVTINTLELPSGYVVNRQFRDYYAATNPLATVVNSGTQTASNFQLVTVNTSTTVFNVESCKAMTAFMTLSGSPTVTTQPVVTIQLSMDGTNWWATTAIMTAAGNGTYSASLANSIAKYARLVVTTANVNSFGSYTIVNIGMNGVN